MAFEGLNRAGKGTQIENLKKVLSETDISFVELRGDGTRDGLGLHDGDPLSPWWQGYSKTLRSEGTTTDWHYAAYLLAKDIKTWKEEGANLDKQIALLDRSIISRAAFVIDRERTPTEILLVQHLYPVQPGPKIQLEDILPDVIFELAAPKEVLLSRLDQKDPKYEFRARMVHEMYDTYYSAKDRLPESVRERIVSIDSGRPPDEVFDTILEILDTRLASWKKLRSRDTAPTRHE